MQTLASLVSLVSPSLLSASAYSGAVCRMNGQVVPCSQVGDAFGSFGFLLPLFFLLEWALIILIVTSMWKIFTKAGQPGWASLIPIYNVVKTLEIVGKPDWWVILMFVPFVNIVVSVIIAYNLAVVFNKGPLFTAGMIFLPFIFYPILAFGSSTYVGSVLRVPTPTPTPSL